jgi:hypothetical protein
LTFPKDLKRTTLAILQSQGRSSLWVEVKGLSMHPTLKPGDRVEVEPAAAADLQLGDIAVLDLGEPGWAIHRFFGLRAGDPPTLRTKGDACPAFDPPWTGDRLLGRARSVQRDGIAHPLLRGIRTWPSLLRSLAVLMLARTRAAVGWAR